MNVQQFSPLIVTLGFLVVFYFLIIRPQKKKEAQVTEMRNNLRIGDEIVTIGGIYGKVTKVREDIVLIEAGPSKTRLEMTKWSIGSVVKKNEKLVKEELTDEETKTDELKDEEN
ncbi:MAG: preprotein translocase subunit YajC [Tissierellaceae bacterium]|nr:preprotein translocase subunit YajC [Tissierellaceae bacterium]